MVTERIPPGLIPGSGSLIFTEETIPGALMQEHTLGAGHWECCTCSRAASDFWTCLAPAREP